MTPAKPQQMSGQDDPDDLIAELTKLMATDNRNAAAESSPASSAPPVRIPGQPTIRIPGVNPPTDGGATAPVVTPGKFDFGQPARPATAPAPEPTTSWQERLNARPAADPLASFDLPQSGRGTPGAAPSSWRPAIAPNEAEEAPKAATTSFDFDFGFNRSRPSEPSRPAPQPASAPVPRPVTAAPPPPSAPAPQPTPQASAPRPSVPAYVPTPAPAPVAAPAPARDPIAELIAAELGAEMRNVAAQPAPAPANPAPQYSAPQYSAPQSYAPVAAPAVAPQVPPPAARPAPPRPAPESDKFSSAPVFGLTGDPTPPKAPLDPMDEIENLIGEAVRVELNMPQPQPRNYATPTVARSAPQQPAVPPLGTQFAPRRTSGLREMESGAGDADEAILAAAAATGAEVGRIDAPMADDRPVRSGKQKKLQKQQQRARERMVRTERPSGGAFRQLVVPAVAGTILVAGGFGLYWALGMGHHDIKAPVLTADATPAKTIPAKPADTTPHSVVMDELGGNNTQTPAPKETLVSRDQTAGGSGQQVASAAATPAPAATTAASTGDDNGGLANRKVRTVTVRPDGSIVNSDDSVAGATQLPVSRPNVPTVPGAAVASAAEPAATDATADTSAPALPLGTVQANTAAPAASSTDTASADATAPTADASSAATADASVGTPDPNAPVPLPPPDRSATAQADDSTADTAAVADTAAATRPASKPRSAVNAVIKSNNPSGAQPVDLIGDANADQQPAAPATRAAASRPAATAQVATADTTAANNVMSTAGGHVQLSSQTSQAGAEASARSLQARYGSVLNGTKLQVVRADLGAKGIYYRVMLPTSTAADAITACTAIKSAGGDCVANR